MSDLIDRAAALDFKVSHGIHEDCEFYVPYGEVKQYLEQLPTADRRGHWVRVGKEFGFAFDNFYCSECNYFSGTKTTNYCPNCGVRLEIEE